VDRGVRARELQERRTLTERQQTKLAWIAKHNHRLSRAYLLKEQLRLVFQNRGDTAIRILDHWLQGARRSQIPVFVELYHQIKRHRQGIIASVVHGLSNGLTESVNTK
jgi:transposase